MEANDEKLSIQRGPGQQSDHAQKLGFHDDEVRVPPPNIPDRLIERRSRNPPFSLPVLTRTCELP
jgi:hypothetical protein